MIFVIADDLTGGAEIAGVCLRYGVKVALGIGRIPEELKTVNVIATDSRSLSETEAYFLHLKLAKAIKLKGYGVVFKKCDSVLRGHVLSELSALVEVFGKNYVLLQPANPKGNRCIKAGKYFVNGQVLAQTGFATDPDFPAKSSEVKEILLARSHKFNVIDQVFVTEFSSFNEAGVYVSDCESETDLERNIRLYSNECLVGGSAAFFEYFLRHQGLASRKVEHLEKSFTENYVLVSGSTHPASIEFAQELEAADATRFLFSESLIQSHVESDEEKKFLNKLLKAYKLTGKLVVRIADKQLNFKGSSKLLKHRLSKILKAFIIDSGVNNIYIEGGATAYDILRTLQWTSFTPIQEFKPGVVCLVFNGKTSKRITIKPGSYSWPKELFKTKD